MWVVMEKELFECYVTCMEGQVFIAINQGCSKFFRGINVLNGCINFFKEGFFSQRADILVRGVFFDKGGFFLLRGILQ